MPPAELPIRKHITRFHSNEGIAPQIEVETNKMVDSRIDTRQPQTKDPTTVPVKATSGSSAAVERAIPYSSRMPGITKPKVAGFIVSITSASTSTASTAACERVSGVSSAAS